MQVARASQWACCVAGLDRSGPATRHTAGDPRFQSAAIVAISPIHDTVQRGFIGLETGEEILAAVMTNEIVVHDVVAGGAAYGKIALRWLKAGEQAGTATFWAP